jgi:hypothetical protein
MIYIAISATLTVCNVAVLAWVILRYIPRKQKSFAERQEAWHEIETRVKEVIKDSTVQRCLVIKLTNGGGEPLPGRQYYATAMIGEVEDQHKRRPVSYNAIQVDSDYLSMVFETRKKGRVFLMTDTMPAGSMLKSFYQEEGVKFAETHYLASTPDATYFMSFATFDEIHLQPSWGAILRCVSDVRRTLKRAFPNAK